MIKDRHNFIGVFVVALIILFFQILLLIHSVHLMQGNARVVNYTGIVRGATQRLVKNELYDNQKDDLIKMLDDILVGLEQGDGELRLTVLDDEVYLSKLSNLRTEWEKLKKVIYIYRNDVSVEQHLFNMSEYYFTLADEVVSAAENYSDGIAKKLPSLEIAIAITFLFMLFLLSMQLILEIKRNGKLNKIAYIDAQTSLPNKRGCEDKINELIVNNSSNNNLCCIVFDLNDLKYVNDTYGHFAGDALIVNFATLLRLIMPEEMFLGRIGGDEFIGLMNNIDTKDINKRLKELEERAKATNIGSSKFTMNISYAYGMAYSKDNPTLHVKALLDLADQYMYQNKLIMKKKIAK